MPCDGCRANCALMCGYFPPSYSEDAYTMEYEAHCDGYEPGNSSKNCDMCTRCGKGTRSPDLEELRKGDEP
jgi:hypothetical protein